MEGKIKIRRTKNGFHVVVKDPNGKEYFLVEGSQFLETGKIMLYTSPENEKHPIYLKEVTDEWAKKYGVQHFKVSNF